jgi:hypothetical protein
LVAGNNIDITVNDAGDTITIDVEALTTADLSDFATAVDERARDAVGAALVAGNNIDITLDDGGNTITIDVEALTSADLSDFTTAAQSLIDTSIAALVDSAPGTLDTLNEIAAALGDDPNFATTITTALGLRTQRYSTTYGNGALTSFAITHGLNTTIPDVVIVEVATGAAWDVPWVVTDANTVTINHTITPTTGQFRVGVLGRAD